jgi:hypothetical protein
LGITRKSGTIELIAFGETAAKMTCRKVIGVADSGRTPDEPHPTFDVVRGGGAGHTFWETEIAMARPRGAGGFTVTQLEQMLSDRKSQLQDLYREHAKAMKHANGILDKIRRLGGDVKGGMLVGGVPVNAGGRARNAKSLVATMEEVLAKAGKPMSVGELLEAIEATGYRSNAGNFRAIINQTLIKERKRFSNTGRGIYALKK